MQEYYYEYAIPNEDELEELNPNERRERMTDPSIYRVIHTGTIACHQNEDVANRVIKDHIGNVYPEYIEYNYGVMLFCEADEATEFTDEDWQKRLERENPDPEHVIQFDPSDYV